MQEYEKRCIDDMASIAPGFRSHTIKKYLVTVDEVVGEDFSAIRALDDLIKWATMLRSEIEKAAINSGDKPFVDDRGRTVRLCHHEHFGLHGTAREVYSPQTGKWYHEAWVE